MRDRGAIAAGMSSPSSSSVSDDSEMEEHFQETMDEGMDSSLEDTEAMDPSPESAPPGRQFRIIKALMDEAEEEPIVAGSTWYLVTSRWLNGWVQWCRQNPRGSPDDEEFPPMNNSELVDEDNFHMSEELIALKWGLREPRDYTVLPESAWRLLQDWYGTEGHVIKRKAYEYAKDETRIEISLASVDFTLLPAGLKETIQLSHANTVKDLKEAVRVLLAHKHPQLTLPPVLHYHFILSNDAGSAQYSLPETEPETDAKMLEEVGLLTEEARLFVDGEPCPTARSLNAAAEAVEEGALKPGAGLVGLRNLGNTCFMNSALQCLLNCDPLRRFILSGQYAADLNKTNRLGTGGVLLTEFASLLRTVWASGPHSVVDPLSFKYALGRFEGRFLGYAQQDSQEFLSALLDRVHEDLNRVREKPYTETPERAGRSDAQVAAEAWAMHRSRNDSAIVDLFHGQLRSTVTCPSCSQVSVTFDPFLFLSLPLPAKRPRSLRVLVQGDELADQVDIIIASKRDRTIGGLKTAVLARVGLSPSSHEAHVIEVYNSQVYRSFTDDEEPLGNIRQPSDDIHVCLAPRGRPMAWFVVGLGKHRLGFPLLVPLKADPVGIEGEQELSDLLKASVLAFAQNPRLEPEHLTLLGQVTSTKSPIPIYALEVESALFMALLQDTQDADEAERPLVAFHHLFLARHRALPASKDAAGAGREEVGLYECLDLFVQEEQLSPTEAWYCARCKEHQQGAGKKLDLWSLPEILVVHLKRFAYDSYYGHKIGTPVAFPVEYPFCSFPKF